MKRFGKVTASIALCSLASMAIAPTAGVSAHTLTSQSARWGGHHTCHNCHEFTRVREFCISWECKERHEHHARNVVHEQSRSQDPAGRPVHRIEITIQNSNTNTATATNTNNLSNTGTSTNTNGNNLSATLSQAKKEGKHNDEEKKDPDNGERRNADNAAVSTPATAAVSTPATAGESKDTDNGEGDKD